MAKQNPSRQVFCDLGSGRGQVVLAMQARWAHVLKECRGIEALPGLVELSKRAAETWAQLKTQGTCHLRRQPVSFTVADFLKDDHLWIVRTSSIWSGRAFHRTGLMPTGRLVCVSQSSETRNAHVHRNPDL